MNLLDVIPGISDILDKTVTTKGELEELKIRLREVDVRELEARFAVQKSWLDNQSVFVAGAIPTILWMVSIVVFFNCVVSPLLTPLFGEMPSMELPGWYADLAGTVILGLFGKKVIDGNEIRWKGEVVKPAKQGKEHDAPENEPATPAGTNVIAPPAQKKPVAKKKVETKKPSAAPAPAPAGKEPLTEPAGPGKQDKYDTADAIDARIAELAEQYGAI